MLQPNIPGWKKKSSFYTFFYQYPAALNVLCRITWQYQYCPLFCWHWIKTTWLCTWPIICFSTEKQHPFILVKRNKMSSCETTCSFYCLYRLNVRMSQIKQARTGRNCLKLHFIVVLSVSKEASLVDYNECEARSVRRLYRSTEWVRGSRGQTDSGGGRWSLNPTTHPHWLADAPPLPPSNLHSVGI